MFRVCVSEAWSNPWRDEERVTYSCGCGEVDGIVTSDCVDRGFQTEDKCVKRCWEANGGRFGEPSAG